MGIEPTPSVDLGAPHFLGREAELEALGAAQTGPGPGRGTSIVELIAPGGTGKTAVVERWLDGLPARGWTGAGRVCANSKRPRGSCT